MHNLYLYMSSLRVINCHKNSNFTKISQSVDNKCITLKYQTIVERTTKLDVDRYET